MANLILKVFSADILLTILISGFAHAGENAWTSLGPEGGDIGALAIDPMTPQTLYAGTSGAGVFKSTNGGNSWIPANTGFTTSFIISFAIDPKAPQTLYAGTFDGVFKSTNGGNSWTPVNTGLTSSLPTSQIFALAIDPKAQQTLYAGIYRGGVFKSTNGGNSWSAVNTGLNATWIRSLVIDPTDPQTLYAGTDEGVFKSTNGGSNWNQLSFTYHVWTLVIDPTDPQTLYAGFGWGVFKTTDGGSNWSQVNIEDFTTSFINSLAIDPKAPQTLYAGTYNDGVFKSVDGGSNWSQVNTGLTDTLSWILAIDPMTPQTLYTGSSGGVFKSTNGGNNWNTANTGLTVTWIESLIIDPMTPQTLYAGTSGAGVFKSTNAGSNWNTANMGLTSPHVNAIAIDPTTPQTLYAITVGCNVFKSTNGGSNWNLVKTDMCTHFINTFVIDPAEPQTLYAGSHIEGVFKSVDGGGSWIQVNTGLNANSVASLAIDPSTPQTIYAGTYTEGVFKSTDGGNSWSSVNTGLTKSWINALVIDPADPQTLYAGPSGEGLFKSTNGGNSWSPINTGLTNPSIYAVAIDPMTPQTLYAGSTGGVFKSTNGGSNWSPINTSLADTWVINLAIDSTTPQMLYAGTNVGVFATEIGILQSDLELTLEEGGSNSAITDGSGSSTQAGYAAATVNSGTDPYGVAVFSFRINPIVSEAAVPASPPTTAARIFIDYRSDVTRAPGGIEAGPVDIYTGLALANCGSDTANVTYTLRNIAGGVITTGHGNLAMGAHFAKFIHQLQDVAPDFDLPEDFPTAIQFGSLGIESDQPLSITALRLTVNQLNEPIYTTTPIADLTEPLNNYPLYSPQFVDGGGYIGTLILLNTSSKKETGTLSLYDDNGEPLEVSQVGGTRDSTFAYSIQPDGVFVFQTNGFPAEANVGSVQLTPDSFTSTPVGAGLFSLTQGGILVSESGLPTATPTTHARIYVNQSENRGTGLAIADPGGSGVSVSLNAFHTDGSTSVGNSTGPLDLDPNGHTAAFVSQFISGLPEEFTGVLDISSQSPFVALTIRSLINTRNNFLMTTFPIADANQPAPAPIVFPQIADGGGYTTEFIFLSVGGPSNATLSFYDEEGAPLAVGK